MKKSVRGFTFVEVLVYIGLFSFVGTAFFSFAWDMVVLTEKGRLNRTMTEESRLMTERMKVLMRSASGVDEEESVWNDSEGRIVLELFGTSDTVILEQKNNVITMQRTGEDPVALHSGDYLATALIFERGGALGQPVSYVAFRSTLETSEGVPSEYSADVTLSTGVSLRNFGL